MVQAKGGPITVDSQSSPPATCFRRRIAERLDKFRFGQYPAHDLALHADAAAVNDAQGLESELVRLFEIRLDHRLYVARRNSMEVENIGDGDADGLVARSKTSDF